MSIVSSFSSGHFALISLLSCHESVEWFVCLKGKDGLFFWKGKDGLFCLKGKDGLFDGRRIMVYFA